MRVPAPLVLLLLLAGVAPAGCGRGAPEASAPPGGDTAVVREVPWLGPHGGGVFPLGEGSACLEYTHSEHWGFASVYLLDAEGGERAYDRPPVLSVFCDGESLQLEPRRENWDGVEDGGWHFEDDTLLGVPERGRLRLHVDGRTYVHPFEHLHLGGHGSHAPGQALEHATGHHVHGPGPHGGTVITIGAHRAHVEVVHDANRGTASLHLFDAAMQPKPCDAPPVLNLRIEDEPVQIVGIPRNPEGNDDGGWHFEDDALLGRPDPGRMRLAIDGRTWTPDLVVGPLPHAHAHAADDHTGCDPRHCEEAKAVTR